MAQKRTRNYTEVEKEEVLRLVESYSHVLENKRTDGVTVKEKKKTWELIANKYSATASTGARTGDQLKMLYNNIKRVAKKGIADEHKASYLEAKKMRAEDKREQQRTGGGSYTPQLTERGARILASVPPVRLPINNPFDDYFEPGAGGSRQNNYNPAQEVAILDFRSEEQQVLAMEEEEVVERQPRERIVPDNDENEEQEAIEANITNPRISRQVSQRRKNVRNQLSSKKIKRRILLNKLKESEIAIQCRRKQLQVLNMKLQLPNNSNN